MSRYETLLLAAPEITSDEVVAIEEQLGKLVNEHKGALISFERWGKIPLAYAVNNHDYGVYFLVRFEVGSDAAFALLAAIKALLSVKHNDMIMRHLTSRLDPRAPLTYQRPETLEDIPGRTTDALLKEHKISL